MAMLTMSINGSVDHAYHIEAVSYVWQYCSVFRTCPLSSISLGLWQCRPCHVYHISGSVDHVYHIFDNIDHVYHISGSVDHVYQSREYFECLEDTDCRDELFLLPERVLDMDRHGGCRQLKPSPSFLHSIFALKFVFFAFLKPVSFVLIL